MNPTVSRRHHELFRQDRAYHEVRVLLLITAIVRHQPVPGLVDGLTKLAKLDFLLRYPLLAGRVLEELRGNAFLLLPDEGADDPPMVQHRYGPWDERYYPVVGALVGRRLVEYGPRGRGRLTLRPTGAGDTAARLASRSSEWRTIATRCHVIAEYAGALTGSQLTQRIHDHLPEINSHDFGESIR